MLVVLPQATTFTILQAMATAIHHCLLQRKDEAPRILSRMNLLPADVRIAARPCFIGDGSVFVCEHMSDEVRLAESFSLVQKSGVAMRGESWIE